MSQTINSNLNHIMGEIKEYIEKNKIIYKIESDIIITSFSISDELHTINEYIYSGKNYFTVIAESPYKISDGQEKNVYKFISLVNDSLIFGHFHVSPHNKLISFRVTKYVDSPLSDDNIKHSIYLPLAMINRYSIGFKSIIFNGTSTEEALAKTEKA